MKTIVAKRIVASRLERIKALEGRVGYLKSKERKDPDLFNLNGEWLDLQIEEEELQRLNEEILD